MRQNQLLEAIDKGDKELFVKLGGISNQDLNFEVSSEGVFPLLIASAKGDKEMVSLILQNPTIDISKTDIYGIMKLLVSKGIDTMSKNQNGSNALHISVKKGNIDVVKNLIDMHYPLNNIKNNGVTAVGIAAYSGNVSLIDILYKAGADINFISKQGITALYLAIKQNKHNCVKYLIDRGAQIHLKDPNFEDVSPIFFAIRMNNQKVIEMMCDTGINFETLKNKQDYDPIHYACKIERDDIVNYLSLRMKNLDTEDKKGRTLLFKYLQIDEFEMCLRLLQRGASINHRNKDGKTILIMQVEAGNEEAVKFLCGKGLDFHIKDNSGNDACYYAKRGVVFASWPEFGQCPYEIRQPPILQQSIDQVLQQDDDFIVDSKLDQLQTGRLPAEDAITPIKINNLPEIKVPEIKQILESEDNLKRFQIIDMIQIPETYSLKMIQDLKKQDDQKFKLDLDNLPRDGSLHPADTHSLLRNEQNNDLKSRRSTERERVKVEAEQKKNELLKKLTSEERPMDTFTKSRASGVKIINNELEDKLQRKEQHLEAESRKLEQIIQEKMRDQESRLRSIRESSHMVNIAQMQLPSLTDQLNTLQSNNNSMLSSIPISRNETTFDFKMRQTRNLKGMDSIKETIDQQRKFLESRELINKLEQKRHRERREIDNMRQTELSKLNSLPDKAADNLSKLRSQLQSELSTASLNKSSKYEKSSIHKEIRNLQHKLSPRNQTQIRTIDLKARKDNDFMKNDSGFNTIQNRNDTSRSLIGYQNPTLSTLAQRLASDRKSIVENAYSNNQGNSRNAGGSGYDYSSVDRIKNNSNELPSLRSNYQLQLPQQSNSNSNNQSQSSNIKPLYFSTKNQFNNNNINNSFDVALKDNVYTQNNLLSQNPTNDQFNVVRFPQAMRSKYNLNDNSYYPQKNQPNQTNYSIRPHLANQYLNKQKRTLRIIPKVQQSMALPQRQNNHVLTRYPIIDQSITRLDIDDFSVQEDPQDTLAQIQDKFNTIDYNHLQARAQDNLSRSLERFNPIQIDRKSKNSLLNQTMEFTRTRNNNNSILRNTLDNINSGNSNLNMNSTLQFKNSNYNLPTIHNNGQFILHTDMRGQSNDKKQHSL
ncbi:ankyrin repeat-containing protein [Stylonychia lemnae]|uniref:Ankyrin repeat-containing protein n=1 Tax=Stylonychia lemnae TaxID=5949 RepID=A0A078AXX9_STYLE|nr:ankyrin repeat-containing protein [Stylonychia lemnae]|eukprot:CDW86931.1 ankyrin repeat-containing protein [Stylonychia lemnae]